MKGAAFSTYSRTAGIKQHWSPYVKYTSTRGFLGPEIFGKSAYYSFILKGHHTHAVNISIVKKPTKYLLKQHFPADLIMESLFSITLTTVAGTQSSLEHTSENVDLEHVLFRYSITCYLHE